MLGNLAFKLLALLVVAVTAERHPDQASECQPAAGAFVHQPQFHIIGSMQPQPDGTWKAGTLNDANAVFERSGIFHVMHQCDGGVSGYPCGGGHTGRPWWHTWGHLVSKDGVHWRRIQDALTPNGTSSTGYEYGEDCDGTVSFPATLGSAVMTFGPACDHRGHKRQEPKTRHSSRKLQSGDAAVVSLAVPTNTTDIFMTGWEKSTANILFDGEPCSFGGSIWEAGDHLNMLCSAGGRWARYSTNATSKMSSADVMPTELHGPWKIADANFAATNGSSKGLGGTGGPSFLPLHNLVAGGPTHIINSGGSSYAVGAYDHIAEKLDVSGGPFRLDYGALSWPAAGTSQRDGRIMMAGWVQPGQTAPDKSAWWDGNPHNCISLLRTVTWEGEGLDGQLASAPMAEYVSLRNSTLYSCGPDDGSVPMCPSVLPNGHVALPLPSGKGNAMDLNATFDLHNATAVTSFSIGVLCPSNATQATQCGTSVQVLINTARVDGSRNVVVDFPKQAEFEMVDGLAGLDVRILVDRSIVEVFIGGGRVASTYRAYPPAGQNGVIIASENEFAPIVQSIGAYEMGCGWEE